MDMHRNLVVGSHNHCYREYATVTFLSSVELHTFAVDSIILLSVAMEKQQLVHLHCCRHNIFLMLSRV
jgi:hypothetical protein